MDNYPGYQGPEQWGQQQPQPGYPPAPPQYVYVHRTTNGLAIASLVLGIVWIYWVGSVLALIFGYVARRQIKEQGQNGDGMAVAGIVLGWIGVGAMVIVLIVWLSAVSTLTSIS